MVKRVIDFSDNPRAYELTYLIFAQYRAGVGKADIAESAMEKLQSIGIPKEGAVGGNPDFVAYTLGESRVELLESERDLVLDAIKANDWPNFGLGIKRQIVSILRDAEAQPVSP